MSKTVMLVDDSSTVLMGVEAMIKRLGLSVITASDGAQAFDKIKSGQKPDLLITDINMPRMNGIELIENVKQLPACRFTPILVLTTEQEQTKRDEARSKGATGYLVKPIGGDQLRTVIKQVLPGI